MMDRFPPLSSDGLRVLLAKRFSDGQGYRLERTLVAVMFDVIGRLLEASCASDPEVAREVQGFPDGYVIGFSLLGDSLKMRVKVSQGKLVRVSPDERAALDITFKHVSHAFAVMSFQESTAQAFANDRAITQGDIALAMRFVRCLNRMQAIALPTPIAEHALKGPLPSIGLRERLGLTARLYGKLARGLTRRTAP